MKLPKPRKLPSGSWFVRVIDEQGNRISITKNSEKECLAEAAAIKAGKKLKKKAPKAVTLREAINTYVDERRVALSPATCRNYLQVADTRFQSIMDTPMSSLNDKVMQTAINKESKICSGKTVKNAWSVINSALVNCGADKPNVVLPPVVKNEHEFLAPDEIGQFLEQVVGSSAEIPILFALHSLRISEIMHVSWVDIDLKHETIRVAGSAVYDSDYQLVHKDTNKTSNSNRVVPIMIPRLLFLLKEQKQSNGYIVTVHENTIRREIKRACERAGLPNVGCHGLRHSFASLALVGLNMPQDVVMRIGGWDNPQTMKTVYTHVSQKTIGDYAKQAKSFFQNGNGNGNDA